MDTEDVITETEHDELPEGNEPIESEKYIADGREFESEAAYYDHLKAQNASLSNEVAMAAAKLEGYQEAFSQQGSNPATAQQMADMQDEAQWDQDKYYEDPTGYLQDFLARRDAQLEKRFDQKMRQQQTDAEVWGEFTARHPQFSAYKDDVTALATRYAKEVGMLARTDRNKAYDYIAGKLTDKFKSYMSAIAPERELPNNGAGPSEGSSNRTVTSSKKETGSKKPLDFASQIRSLRG